MHQVILNVHVYAKWKINLTLPKMLVLTFSSKLDWGSYFMSIAKTASKKIGSLIGSIKFFSREVAVSL